ncbi:MAG: hypothetical protein J6P71_08680, partial [Oscillospiraceae bacterium]|nr:hypothetical protein [Oscillospiraceae bacterium]
APDLKRDVRRRGFRFAEYAAKWAEDGAEREARSLLIPGIRLERAIEIGRKHGRQTVVFKDGNVCAEYCAAPFGGHYAGDSVATYDVDKNDPLNVRLLRAVFSGGAPLEIADSFRLYERELINTRLGFTEHQIGMSRQED